MRTLLVLALLAPALGAAVGLVAPANMRVGARLSSLAAAACWLAIVVDGASGVRVGFVHATPVLAAACCGAALVVAATSVGHPGLSSVALLVLELALAGGRVHNEGSIVVAGVAVVAAAALVAVWPEQPRPEFALLTAAAFIALVIGVVTIRQTTGDWNIPIGTRAGVSLRVQGIALLAGAALLVMAAGVHVRARAPGALLVAAAAYVGTLAAPLARSHHPDASPAAVLLALLAVVAAAGRGERAPFDRPTLALGLLGLAALVAPGHAGAAALLLLAAAVLAAAMGSPAAAALGLPGAIAFALALAVEGGGVPFVLGAASAAVALGLAADVARSRRPSPPPWWVLPAAAVGGWLLVAPGSWGWVAVGGSADLRSYDAGAARALAVGLVAVEALVLRRREGWRWYSRASPRADPVEE